MTVSGFHAELKKFPNLDEGFVKQLSHFQEEYPYCPLFPILLARAEQESGTGEQVELHRAAIYTADRAHLRELLIDGKVVSTGKHVGHIDYADQIFESLLALKKSQATFEALAYTDALKKETSESTVKKERKAGKTKETQEEPSASSAAETAPKPARASRKSSDPGEVLLQEIKSSHRKQKPENARQQEQLDIIEQFIKVKPSSRPNARTEKSASGREDLSTGNEQYSENVISETLVDILIRQGKRDKAIQVLKKLIWKFPQKKALFTARIQELSQ